MKFFKVKEILFQSLNLNSWEQRKYGDIAELSRGLTYSPSNIVKHGTRVLRSSNINEDYFVKSDDDVFVEDGCININNIDIYKLIIGF